MIVLLALMLTSMTSLSVIYHLVPLSDIDSSSDIDRRFASPLILRHYSGDCRSQSQNGGQAEMASLKMTDECVIEQKVSVMNAFNDGVEQTMVRRECSNQHREQNCPPPWTHAVRTTPTVSVFDCHLFLFFNIISIDRFLLSCLREVPDIRFRSLRTFCWKFERTFTARRLDAVSDRLAWLMHPVRSVTLNACGL